MTYARMIGFPPGTVIHALIFPRWHPWMRWANITAGAILWRKRKWFGWWTEYWVMDEERAQRWGMRP